MARWNTTSHASTVRIRAASGTRFSTRPYAAVPSSPPSAEAVMSSPKPASSMPTRSSDHRTSTDHGAAQVMLKATITRARVRTGLLPPSQRTPSAMSWRTWVVDVLAHGAARRTDAGHEDDAERDAHGLDHERERHAGREDHRTDGRPDQLVGR